MLTFSLPYPPSINRYYRSVKGRVLISKQGREYRETVASRVVASKLEGRLSVAIMVCPPDNRRRDIDNIQKPLLDALEHAEVYINDSQIDQLYTCRKPKVTGGRVDVTIEEILQ